MNLSTIRTVLASPLVFLAILLYGIYALVAMGACLVGGKRVINFIHDLTESAIL